MLTNLPPSHDFLADLFPVSRALAPPLYFSGPCSRSAPSSTHPAELGAPLAGWQPHPAQPSPGFIVSPCIICLIPVSEKGGCAESLQMAGRTKPHPRYPKVQNICLNLSGPQRCALAASQDLLLVFAMNLAHREQRGEFDGVKKHRSLCGSQDILDQMQPCWCQSLRLTEEPLVSHLVLVMQMS